MTGSVVYKLTLSAEVAALVEQHRGVLSVQEFAIHAMLEKCQGTPGERALRDEIERLHVTLALVLASPGAPQSTLSIERQNAVEQPTFGTSPLLPAIRVVESDKLDW